jgi:hypothetical protein
MSDGAAAVVGGSRAQPRNTFAARIRSQVKEQIRVAYSTVKGSMEGCLP